MNTLRFALPFLATLGAFADVKVAPIFTDHAVLQRDKPVPVWGRADAGEEVTVSFAGQTLSTKAAEDGRWSVTLAPMPANRAPAELTVRGKNTLRFTDILVGEVWFASGQSNMEWLVKNSDDVALEVPASAALPHIRHYWLDKQVADAPRDTAKGIWRVTGPKTTGGYFATAYYFSRDVAAVLDVPVGVIESAWGGTPIESWMTAESIDGSPAFAAVRQRWADTLAAYPAAKESHDRRWADWNERKTAAKKTGAKFTEAEPRAPEGPGHRYTPAGLYNAMIHPFAPGALRGVIWYQGENNTGRPEEYDALFPAMIKGWRAAFGQGDIPFYWVQLANYRGSGVAKTEFARLREAQDKTLALPATGQAVAIDLGNVADIHPRNKAEVGRRLARLALKRAYGVELADEGPRFARAERVAEGYRIHFSAALGGLVTPREQLTGFELAGDDRAFRPAQARIEGETVLVLAEAGSEPVAVRYAWRNAPEVSLYNREGLPAAPFRTDAW